MELTDKNSITELKREILMQDILIRETTIDRERNMERLKKLELDLREDPFYTGNFWNDVENYIKRCDEQHIASMRKKGMI